MILYGKPVVDALREQCAERIEAMAWRRTLLVLKDGTTDKQYLSAIQREAEKWGINLSYGGKGEKEEEDEAWDTCYIDLRESGAQNIYWCRSADGQSTYGRYMAYLGKMCDDTPCTAEAIIRMLDYYNIPIAGRHAVVIGRSERVGKPTAMLLLARDATVTVCHSRTDKGNLLKLVAGADIVVCASGQKGLIDWTWVPHGCTVINVGGDYISDGYEEYDTGINLIPFKGGVGPVTTAVLMSHVLM